MSNTIYCICATCEKFMSLKDGEEDEFKDKHYGHEVLIIVPAYLEVTYYDPEAETVRYASEMEE